MIWVRVKVAYLETIYKSPTPINWSPKVHGLPSHQEFMLEFEKGTYDIYYELRRIVDCLILDG